MEYQEMITLLDQFHHLDLDQKIRLDINDDSRGSYNTNSKVKFKTLMLKSSLCDYSDVYILAKGIKTFLNAGTTASPNNRKISNI